MAEIVDVPEASLRNLIAQKSLQWIFVGGKGGVGKTTTSCCLAIQLAAQREKVLIVSTDPAHNLSDAFGQKFTREPKPVNGISNLAVMEIDPNVDLEEMNADGVQDNSGMASFMKDLTNSIPGIDEAMSFAELMKQVQNMDYSVIVFDTAPTGHTLRLLSFPTALDKAFDKIMSLKNQFSGVFSQVSALLGGALPSQEMLLGKLEQTREVIQKVNAQFKDPERTTFVCVCIPEFLSLYETERLVQELTKYEIDVHNVVVNQVLYPEEGSKCKSCSARQNMQQKYIDQIYDLYEDFHVVEMPLLTEEVRGVPSLTSFSKYLLAPFEPDH
ncbi:anion-transporting atpase [Plasmopara halstedii]|uniref:ATPase ASNA1 homolog n=1 Tax=Plasmopara halstedii TaxID=4781 RepID=A0A0P1B605_PLAHL|nr:anion-transporting atpase [Plasmopara halstedii]CEG49130.1 anion-transporting atpase [Plasmopara halstedii]|eukprot:XP_024585499.1 anion-transporting atpase [Plasmopara halstedii]